ncbi:hypothetical protein CCHL11_08283 [Colletotrichum chlorophyti]|uniref:Uncharacterized protein n=1 Tax=Colletotrichum chlorophyti TaxID=708187 RepID=A0A1Q8RMU3_9PEZI|nr:hypothetical protein CCHL11_08283 [Colletotrichum chlorophyti]
MAFVDAVNGNVLHLAKLTLLVSFLRESSRTNQSVSPSDLDKCWDMASGAVSALSKEASGSGFKASRSAQGFLAIPLCSLVKDGNLDELFRLHVWLPDKQRGNPDFAVHSHQPFAQSWIIAGEGRDHAYKVDPVTVSEDATHAKYALSWSGTNATSHGTAYTAHQSYSIVENTGQLFRATEISSEEHARNTTYSVHANAFHRSEVDPDILHATFFFFDASRGFVKDAGVLGPKNGKPFKQYRDPAGITPLELVEAIESVRSWELLIDDGKEHARKAEWEDALRSFNSALNLCTANNLVPNSIFYRHLVLGELGSANRRFGRYQPARDSLEEAINGMKPCIQRVELSGELGVTYRHLGLFEDAGRAFSEQYETAKELNSTREMCRAIGNLGMINYQLSLEETDNKLLDVAITQLTKRVRLAESLIRGISPQPSTASSKRELSMYETWKTIGLCRLSMCHYARGNIEEAIASSGDALKMTEKSDDVTVKAMTRFFHGRALLMDGKVTQALSLFNVPGTCSPAIAFAKEPSEEHRGYLRELVNHGADFDIADEQGYTAIDHAVFNGDVLSEKIILEGLSRNSESKIGERQTEARLRKGYRELFQEKLRPALLGGGRGVLASLRKAYADALEADEVKSGMFDRLKFMWYSEFVEFNRLPRSSDGLAREFDSAKHERSGQVAEKVVFISYRWINKAPGAKSPDDDNNTQYRRMINAIEGFLQLNPSVNRETLGIWMDHACVDQDDPNAGVSALPMIIAQCDAMISLVDDDYYTRGWCAVEVMMADTLRSSYQVHQWYEHFDKSEESDGRGTLRTAENRGHGTMKDKRLTYETDRPKILFLERQSKLLG